MPAGADEAEHRRFADVDVPAEQRDRPERRLAPAANSHSKMAAAAARRPPSAPRSGRGFASSIASARSLPVKPIERNGDGERAGKRARAEHRDEQQRPDQRVAPSAMATRMKLARSGSAAWIGVMLRATRSATGTAMSDREDRAERRDMQRLDQCADARPSGTSAQSIGHMRANRSPICCRRVVEELRDDLDRAQRQHHDGDGRDSRRRARQALRRA